MSHYVDEQDAHLKQELAEKMKRAEKSRERSTSQGNQGARTVQGVADSTNGFLL